MSKARTRKELTRLAWITALRLQGNRQCFGRGREEGNVCAMELLSETIPDEVRHSRSYIPVGAMAGLSARRVLHVIRLNDGSRRTHRHTFSEIADVVESWFSKTG